MLRQPWGADQGQHSGNPGLVALALPGGERSVSLLLYNAPAQQIGSGEELVDVLSF